MESNYFKQKNAKSRVFSNSKLTTKKVDINSNSVPENLLLKWLLDLLEKKCALKGTLIVSKKSVHLTVPRALKGVCT